ncbi:MAG: hypothetical protein E7353_03875 [Clostridiales bacterium]|nr:hypothetical protein [Clostridiales bacterium]
MKVVYMSNTGFTEQYARFLASTLGCEALELKDALSSLRKKSEIIYFGWINGGKIMGLKKAIRNFNPICICSVGISMPSDEYVVSLREDNKINLPLFYLQGGFDYSRLKGTSRIKMNIARSLLKKTIEKKENPDESEKFLLDVMENGGNFVDRNKIKSIADWYYSRYMI